MPAIKPTSTQAQLRQLSDRRYELRLCHHGIPVIAPAEAFCSPTTPGIIRHFRASPDLQGLIQLGRIQKDNSVVAGRWHLEVPEALVRTLAGTHTVASGSDSLVVSNGPVIGLRLRLLVKQ